MFSAVLIITFLTFAQGEVTITDESGVAFKYRREGSSIRLDCKSSEPNARLTWTFIDTEGNRSNILVNEPSVIQIRGEIATLERSLTMAHNGEHICEDDKGGKMSYFVNVYPKDRNAKPPLLHGIDNITLGTPKEVFLTCQQPFAEKIPIIWTFEENKTVSSPLNNLKNGNFSVDEKAGFALRINNKDAGDRFGWGEKYGTYWCKFDLTNVTMDSADRKRFEEASSNVKYAAAPDVSFEGAAKTKSATKDETYRLACIITGSDLNEPVEWFYKRDGSDVVENIATETLYDAKINTTISDKCKLDDSEGKLILECLVGNGSKYKILRDLKHENDTCPQDREVFPRPKCERKSILFFTTVVDEDRGQYSCQSKNAVGQNNATAPMKVKDKLAALWPFLGIVAEVVILCAIIFCYERRRSKSIEEEDEAEPMKTVDARDATENVRNRKA